MTEPVVEWELMNYLNSVATGFCFAIGCFIAQVIVMALFKQRIF